MDLILREVYTDHPNVEDSRAGRGVDAIEMLHEVDPAPAHVVSNIVIRLLQKNQIDQAIELVGVTGSTGVYSFDAVEQILMRLFRPA